MKYFFLNPQSCSGLALKKWGKVAKHLQETGDVVVVENFYQIDWKNFDIKSGDSCISAGGDGTLHCMVNALIANKGLPFLEKIKIGDVGLGSNNSFLRPYSDCTIIHDVPMKISDVTYVQDLMEVSIQNGYETKTVYCMSNSSLGFLATANILFNNSSDIAILKKWNSDLADVYTFLKALIHWKPISITYSFDEASYTKFITNVHFMKKPYYATDLGFPEAISSNNGKFRLNVLLEKQALVILKKFFSMLIFKKLTEGRDMTSEVSQVNVHSKEIIPIELDGEIYYGTSFRIKTLQGGAHLCK